MPLRHRWENETALLGNPTSGLWTGFATMLLRYRISVWLIWVFTGIILDGGAAFFALFWFFFMASMIPHLCFDTLSHVRRALGTFLCWLDHGEIMLRQRQCCYAIAGTACRAETSGGDNAGALSSAGLVGVLWFWITCFCLYTA